MPIIIENGSFFLYDELQERHVGFEFGIEKNGEAREFYTVLGSQIQ